MALACRKYAVCAFDIVPTARDDLFCLIATDILCLSALSTLFQPLISIIKNEVLFRITAHPESLIGALPKKQLKALAKEARNYSFDFLEWKKAYVLKKHWLAHTKKICPRCDIPFIRRHTGNTNRRSFFVRIASTCKIKFLCSHL